MHLHVCGLLVLDTSTMVGGYSFEAIRRMLVETHATDPCGSPEACLGALWHQPAFFGVDDPDLDVDRHLHRVALASQGDDRALATLTGELASWPLARDRPLWEMWVIEGLEPNRVALLVKMHHATIDGVSGANMMAHLFDLEPAGHAITGGGETQNSDPVPSRLTLLTRGLASRLAEPWDLVTLVPTTAARVGSMAWRLLRRRDTGAAPAAPFSAPRTSFNATITPRRSVAFTDMAFKDVKIVKDAMGVTVNDVVTAVVGGALRRYLDDRGELPEHSLLAAAPVSVHGQVGRGGTTKVSVMFSRLDR